MTVVAAPIARARRMPRWLVALLVAVGVIAVACMLGGFAVARYVSTPRFRNNGISMTPCFADGATLTANKLDDGERQALRRGDIVIYRPPINTESSYIKRIIAVGGDQIAIHDGKVFLNGAALDEPYVAQPALYRYPLGGDAPYTVPDGAVFALGDNRNNSADSHVHGAVTLDRVTHKVTSSCAGRP